MPDEQKELHRKIWLNLGLAVLAVIFCVFALPRLLHFFFPLIVAWIVAMIANPIIRFLEKKIKIMRKHGTALIIILVLAAVIAAVYGLIVLVASQFSYWIGDLPHIYDSMRENLQQLLGTLHEKYHIIPASMQAVFDQRENAMDDYIKSALDKAVDLVNSRSISKVGSVASSLMDFLVYTILTILASYFITVEKDHFGQLVRESLPEGVQSFVDRVRDIFFRAIGGYFKAHFKIMIVVFVITAVPFTFMGISYSGLLAAVIAVVDFLPVFGAGTILIPWAVYRLITGSYRYAALLFVLYIIILVVRQLLEPKLIGDSIGISPFETLIFMLIGYRLGGMGGLIFGIPIGMILVECYREGMFEQYIRGIKILVHDLNEYRKY